MDQNVKKIECEIKRAQKYNKSQQIWYPPNKCSSAFIPSKSSEKNITLVTTPLGLGNFGSQEAQEMVALPNAPNGTEHFRKFVYICEPYGKKRHKSNRTYDQDVTYWFAARKRSESVLDFSYLKYERKSDPSPPTYTFYTEVTSRKKCYKPPERLHVLPMFPGSLPCEKLSGMRGKNKFSLSSIKNWSFIHGMKRFLCWKCSDEDGSSGSDGEHKSGTDCSCEPLNFT